MLNNKITYIDLFAGAGGLSEGFIREKFVPVAHIEKDKYASLTIKTRLAYHYLNGEGKESVYYNYLRGGAKSEHLYDCLPKELQETVIDKEISNENITNIFETINNNLKTLNQTKVDLIIGGPPCQAYSVAGRARIRDEKQKENDPRRFLFRLYIQFLKQYEPNMFVFENVPGILSAKDVDGLFFIDKMKQEFLNVGYNMEYKTLNATNYGVLQNRNRVFILGWKKNKNILYPNFPITPTIDFLVSRDLLSDLPPLKAGEAYKKFDYKTLPSNYLKDMGIRNDNDVLTWHTTRPHNNNDLEIYKLAINKWFDGNKRLLYTDLPKELQKQKNQTSFLNRFSVVEGDKSCAHTMVAHIAQDGHYYIHPDIEQLRSISVREAARIQSFPDNYFFEGSRTSAFKQIGNAVPPLVAQAIAKKLKEII